MTDIEDEATLDLIELRSFIQLDRVGIMSFRPFFISKLVACARWPGFH
jgi:hypothetical protein